MSTQTETMDAAELLELDMFCAEVVMGFHRTERPNDLTSTAVRQCYNDSAKVFCSTPYEHAGWCDHEWAVFSPTSNAADAMVVLQKCVSEAKSSVCLCLWIGGFQVYLGGSAYGTSVMEAKTLELTICLFARKLWRSDRTVA